MKAGKTRSKMNKRGMELEYLGYILIGIAALAIVIFAMIVLKGKGISAIDYIKNLFRFGK